MPEPGRGLRIHRFSGAERTFHWLLAVTFFIMLGTGLALFVPRLADVMARPVAKEWHVNAALALAAGVFALFAAHWPRLRATMRDLDRFDRDDARWLFGWSRLWRRTPAPPQGRFNAGQKLNSALIAGLMVIEFITGGLLLLGERNTSYRFAGTVIVHNWVTWILIALVVGHLYMAMVNRSTRHAMRGIVVGDVDRDWARRHHEKWVDADEAERSVTTPQETAPPK